MRRDGQNAWVQRAAFAAVALQLALLSAWALPHPKAVAIAMVGLLGAVLLINARRRTQGHPAQLTVGRSPIFEHLALGGCGMLLGAWVDARFGVPPCLCCRFGTQASLWSVGWAGIWTLSSLGMLAGCAAAKLGAVREGHATSVRTALPACAAELVAMWLGMLMVMQPASRLMRALPWGKLQFGHALMLVGMGLGTWICSRVLRLTRVQGHSA